MQSDVQDNLELVFTLSSGLKVYKTNRVTSQVCNEIYKHFITDVYKSFELKIKSFNIDDIIDGFAFIRSGDEIINSLKMKNTHPAFFDPNLSIIYINVDTIKKISNSELFKELFCHEIGHAVHLKYISPASKQYFDDFTNVYMKFIYSLKQIIKKIEDKFFFKKTYAKNTHKKVLRFFDNFLNNQEEEIKEELKKTYEDYKVTDEQLAKFFKKDIKGNQDIVEEVIKDIYRIIKTMKMLYVSEYSLTNKEEDFAELFCHWLLNEDKMSEIQLKRIKLCFSLSKKDGKVIIENKNSILKNYIGNILENYFI